MDEPCGNSIFADVLIKKIYLKNRGLFLPLIFKPISSVLNFFLEVD